jgi:hypothetical protein
MLCKVRHNEVPNEGKRHTVTHVLIHGGFDWGEKKIAYRESQQEAGFEGAISHIKKEDAPNIIVHPNGRHYSNKKFIAVNGRECAYLVLYRKQHGKRVWIPRIAI